MASDSSSVDRPGIVVTIVLCPHCDGKYPTEDRENTKCIYCAHVFKVGENDFDIEAVRVRVIGKYCQKDPKACFHVCSTCHKAHIARQRAIEEREEPPPSYWWQRD